eukprot:7273172-Pyramimonas_sp.AAC.1
MPTFIDFAPMTFRIVTQSLTVSWHAAKMPEDAPNFYKMIVRPPGVPEAPERQSTPTRAFPWIGNAWNYAA